MTTTQIIQLIVILIGISVIAGAFLMPRVPTCSQAVFAQLFTDTETFIMDSGRDNVFAARRAISMINRLIQEANTRSRRRQIRQLHILWKSKFAHLYK